MLEEYQDVLLNIAHYSRNFYVRIEILADLNFQLVAYFHDQGNPLKTLEYSEICYNLMPYNLIYIKGFVNVSKQLGKPYQYLVKIGLLIEPKNNLERECYRFLETLELSF